MIAYLVIQRESVGGVHDRTAEVRDSGRNSGLSGGDGEPELDGSYETTLFNTIMKQWTHVMQTTKLVYMYPVYTLDKYIVILANSSGGG